MSCRFVVKFATPVTRLKHHCLFVAGTAVAIVAVIAGIVATVAAAVATALFIATGCGCLSCRRRCYYRPYQPCCESPLPVAAVDRCCWLRLLVAAAVCADAAVFGKNQCCSGTIETRLLLMLLLLLLLDAAASRCRGHYCWSLLLVVAAGRCC